MKKNINVVLYQAILTLLVTVCGVQSFWGQVKIGDNAENVNPQAILELESNRLGFIWPRLTNAERDAAFTQNIPQGLTIFNTDEGCIQFWNGIQWRCSGNGEVKNYDKPDDLPTTAPRGTLAQVTLSSGQTIIKYFDGSGWISIYDSNDLGGSGNGGGGVSNTLIISGVGIPSRTATNTEIKSKTPGTLYVDHLTGNVYVAVDDGYDAKQGDGIADSWNPIEEGTAGPRGVAGAPGPRGAAGKDGLNGAGVITAATLPTGTHSPTDMFINTSTGDIYVANGSTTSWTLVPPQSIAKGNTHPAITGYKENDLYVNTASNTLLIFKNGPARWETLSGKSFYDSDGKLTDKRTVDMDNKDLKFETKKGDFKIVSDNNNNLLFVDGERNNLGIGLTNQITPNDHAILDIRDGKRGVLFPRVSLTDSTTLTPGTNLNANYNGMLVFNTNTVTQTTGLTGQGLYYYDWDEAATAGTWKKIATGESKLNIYQTDGQLEGDRVVTLGTSATDTTTLRFSGGASNTLNIDTPIQLSKTVLDSEGKPGEKGQVLISNGASNTVSWGSGAEEEIRIIDTAGPHALTVTDTTIFVDPPGATTLTLPAADKVDPGKKITIKRIDEYNGGPIGDTLKIEPKAATDTIDGTTAYNLNVSYQGYTLQVFNKKWHIIQRF